MKLVNVRNERQWVHVQGLLVNRGVLWGFGEAHLPYTGYIYGVNTCILLDNDCMRYGDKKYHIKRGDTVITYAEFLKEIEEGVYGSGTR